MGWDYRLGAEGTIRRRSLPGGRYPALLAGHRAFMNSSEPVRTPPGTLSVILITRNEAHRLAECLASVAFADECIVVDLSLIHI